MPVSLEKYTASLAKRAPHIPANVMARIQAYLYAGHSFERGIPTALDDFYNRLTQADLPPDLVTEEIYASVATSRTRLRTLLKGLRLFAPDVPLSPAAPLTQRWDAWLNARYNAKPARPRDSRRVGLAPEDWPEVWAVAVPNLDRTVRPYGNRLPRLALKTQAAVISAVGLLAKSREWAGAQGVEIAPTPSADLFEAFFRFLITQRGVSFGTAADYCERLRMFFMRAGLFNEDSLTALGNLTGALKEEAADSDPGKWTKLRAFRKNFTLGDLLSVAIAAAQDAKELPGHSTAALRLRQKAVSYALLVNTGDRQGDLRHFEIGVDLTRNEVGDWHHAIRTSKTGRRKEIAVLWPGCSRLIDAHILGDRPAWMIERRVAELQGANLLTLTEAVVNEGFINLRLKDDFKIHGHLVRTLLTDLMRRERPDARWAAQHMLGHEDRYMQETYRSDFAESGAIRAMDCCIAKLEEG